MSNCLVSVQRCEDGTLPRSRPRSTVHAHAELFTRKSTSNEQPFSVTVGSPRRLLQTIKFVLLSSTSTSTSGSSPTPFCSVLFEQTTLRRVHTNKKEATHAAEKRRINETGARVGRSVPVEYHMHIGCRVPNFHFHFQRSTIIVSAFLRFPAPASASLQFNAGLRASVFPCFCIYEHARTYSMNCRRMREMRESSNMVACRHEMHYVITRTSAHVCLPPSRPAPERSRITMN
ncbi:hypothetical protein BDW22DRAFT_967478 [Trametopsis cervina]|nr:hypothetical protein BDW22DRAFT_967478 [Trametopsis cervina]